MEGNEKQITEDYIDGLRNTEVIDIARRHNIDVSSVKNAKEIKLLLKKNILRDRYKRNEVSDVLFSENKYIVL